MLRLRTAVLLLGLVPLARAQSGEDLVSVRAVPFADGIVPGRSLEIGILFSIAPGWHVYWRNPGDAGAPTTVQLDLPDGFRAGPLRWPAPERVELPGDLIDFVHRDELLLVAPVEAPPGLEPGTTIRIGLEVGWLVCDPEMCLDGARRLEVELPVVATSRPAGAEVLEAWRPRLEAPHDPVSDPFEVRAIRGPLGESADGFEIELTWKGDPPARIEAFPAPDASIAIDASSAERTASGAIVRVRARRLEANPAPLFVLVAHGEVGADRARVLHVTLPFPADGR